MSSISKNITVLGSGSWGTALAILLARNGHHVKLWGRNSEALLTMQSSRQNPRYLPDIEFPSHLNCETDFAKAVSDASEILIVLPSYAFRETCKQLQSTIAADVPVIWASKGFEAGSLKLLHQVVAEELGGQRHTAVVSGPTFAKEVAIGLPTAMTVASSSEKYASHLADWLHNESFRAYTSTDVIGVEVGGAVKNVMAIAAGIVDGLGLGANTRAALITRGLAEIQRLGLTLGAKAETFMGLAGLGDLVLTCTDNQSRNRRVGIALAQGKNLEAALAELGQVAEGVNAAKQVNELAKKHQVEMPIAEQVYAVLYENKSPKLALQELYSRAVKAETV
ncbi:MAG: NAD(P)-dependent glycerol-3-phosphate dehydrogenase [Gammaproteobacteria bacterium]|nr:NAD(P)-dependent glycerol-3-phosphate dehydrogenase [Gammaproteobacteria bacterium]MDH5728875.1 NAD(P)-dependent glycerol-3-phosphate dehydrogenase [Gammaproteobacteria bacterium]